ncbi:MAG: tetratricopeptide repeat protein [Bacteroidales bacterium]|nr:tetratricopeptide repeat protein [Bacteroidales bacterium]
MILLFLAMTLFSWSQQENRLIRQGNRQYKDGNYKEAEIDYLKSVQSEKSTHKGFFNLGDAWYMQKNYVQAAAAFDTLRTFKMDDETRSKSYYNLGNSLLKASIDSAQLAQQFLPASIEAYKQSLRLDPEDPDAKYNLAYAQKLLQKSQQQQQDQKQDKQDKQDQQQDQKQDQQKDQQKEEEQEQQQQDQAKQDQQDEEQQQQQQAQSQQISKEDAERILEALKNDEKETLEKLKQAKIQSTRVIKSDKDW